MAACADVTQSREIDRAKNEFISTVSHELRTPLTSLKGALTLLLEGATPLDAEMTELLQISQRNANRLVSLVADILDLSKLEADRLELRLAPCAPEQLCRMALAELANLSSRSDVKLHVEVEPGLPRVNTDAERVLQILSNLLSNAFKFSPAHGLVILRAKPAGGAVRFEVQDRGPGVALDFRDKLFTKFAQSERTRQEQSGTGLGLAICQAMVEKLGGEIGCDSVPGEGATFFFTLPVLDPQPGNRQ
jgi:signal transduction histidine kinase